MKREDIRKLLGGYATGTLTAEERQALFEAALEDQELFDALAKEEPLRELLEDPAARARLLAALDDSPLPSLLGQALSPANRLPWFRRLVGQALPPANRLPRLEQWLWDHAVGIAAVACFLTVGGYVAWQARNGWKPTLMAEMERQSIEVRDSAPPEKHRAFDPGAVTRKPAPAMALPAPPVVAPPRPAPVNLPAPRMAPLPPPPAPKSSQFAVRSFRGETTEVAGAAPPLMTQSTNGASPPAPKSSPVGAPAGALPGMPAVSIVYDSGSITIGSLGRPDMPQTGAGAAPPSGPGAAEPRPALGRGAGGFAASRTMGSVQVRAAQGARDLYGPALAPAALKAESAPARAGGGGGGGGGRGGSGGGSAGFGAQAGAAPAATLMQGSRSAANAAARPAASLGVRYQVLRRAASGEYQELAAGSDLAVGDTVKLRFIPNSSGYLCAALAANPAALLQRRVAPFEAVETPGIEVSYAPARLEMYVLFTREDQPRMDDANPFPFITKVRQGASGTLSESAGMEGVYVVNPAPGAPNGVPFLIILNFK